MGKMDRRDIWQERFRQLVENVTDYAFFTLDPAGRVTEWNVGGERLLGYRAEDILHENFAVFYTPADRKIDRPSAELRAARRTGRVENEGWRVRKDGSHFWAGEVLSATRDRSGKVIGFTRIIRDLTERREAEDALRMMNESLERRVRERTAALESYQRELKSLALQLSRTELQERHRLAADLHGNLAQLLALCEIKLASISDFSPREKTDKVLENVRHYVEQAIHYTRSLMSRLSPPVRRRRQLAWAIKALVEEMAIHGLKVELQDECKGTPVDSEVLALLYQGVRELLFNVLKHSRCAHAKVTLRCVEGIVEVSVRDYGVGFPRSTRTKKRLFGFGLQHLRERLKLVGGRLEILPNVPKGTHILMAAPRKKNSHRVVEASDLKEKVAPRRSSIRVLIVDDNKLMREGLRKVLSEQQDLKVIGDASTGEAAVAMVRRLKPDVVLMDINMAGMGGVQATREISRRSRRTAVIGFSIHEDKRTADTIRKAGARAYVTKQESPEKLYATIRDHSGVKPQ